MHQYEHVLLELCNTVSCLNVCCRKIPCEGVCMLRRRSPNFVCVTTFLYRNCLKRLHYSYFYDTRELSKSLTITKITETITRTSRSMMSHYLSCMLAPTSYVFSVKYISKPVIFKWVLLADKHAALYRSAEHKKRVTYGALFLRCSGIILRLSLNVYARNMKRLARINKRGFIHSYTAHLLLEKKTSARRYTRVILLPVGTPLPIK